VSDLTASPPRYAPVRHPGVPRRWGRATIVDALRTWAAETGGPPRRQDWSGEQPDRATSGQRKWMAEHPRWPSSSCVSAHFGSWSCALEEAGLPVRNLTFDNSVAERVEAACRLAARGLTRAEIGRTLGVSPSTVGNYLRARPCTACGGPVTSRQASRWECTAHEPAVARPWTRASVRSAICDWQLEHGRPPTCREWTPSRTRPGRWEDESPRWPSAAVVCDLYADRSDPWDAALVDAGAAVRFRRWNDDAIRAALASFWAQTGRAPVADDLCGPAWQGPCAATLRRRFGGLDEAWQALGPVPVQRYVRELDAPSVARMLKRSERTARRRVLERLARAGSAPVHGGDLDEPANGRGGAFDDQHGPAAVAARAPGP
jgi:hypothetical protein